MAFEVLLGWSLLFRRRREPVRYHFLHDLESAWWLYLWNLLERVPHPASQQYAREIYINSVTQRTKREQIFVDPDLLYQELKGVVAESLQELVDPLHELHKTIYFAYFEVQDRSDKSQFSAFYGQFIRLCDKSMTLRPDFQLASFPIRPKFKRSVTKRSSCKVGKGDDDEYQPSEHSEEDEQLEDKGLPKKRR